MAFLAKISWRIIQEESHLWANILHSKYTHRKEVMEIFKPRQGVSNAWQGIVKSSHIIAKELRKMVHNGEKVILD